MHLLKRKLDALCRGFDGEIGYCLKLLGRRKRISFNGDHVFPSASTIKTAVMVEAFARIGEGSLQMTERVAIPPLARRETSMWAFFMRDGIELDVDGMVNLMVTLSDNTATIMCRDFLGTLAINRRMEKLGLRQTKVLGHAPPEATEIHEFHRRYGMGMTTPREMNRLLELIYLGRAASPAACDRMQRILSHQYWDDVLGSTVPPDVQVGLKSGALDDFRADCAIVYGPVPYILTIYTNGFQDRRWAHDNEASETIRAMGRMVWAFLQPDGPYRRPEGFERFLPTGGGVDDEVF